MSNSTVYKAMAFIIGLIVIGFGIMLNMYTNDSFEEYDKSSDQRTVEATIVDVQPREVIIRKKTRSVSEIKETKYECVLEYTIDGNLMRNYSTYSEMRREGEKVTLNVYKDESGHYQIGTITSMGERDTFNSLAYLVIFVGIGIIIIGAIIKIK